MYTVVNSITIKISVIFSFSNLRNYSGFPLVNIPCVPKYKEITTM